MLFTKNTLSSHGYTNPRGMERLWLDQFTWVCHAVKSHAAFC